MDIGTDLAIAKAHLANARSQLETRTRQLADAESAHAEELWRAHRAWIAIAVALGVLGVIIGHLA